MAGQRALVVCGNMSEFAEYCRLSGEVGARPVRDVWDLQGLDPRQWRLVFVGRFHAHPHIREIVDVWRARGGEDAEMFVDPRRAAYEQEQERIRVLQQQQMLAQQAAQPRSGTAIAELQRQEQRAFAQAMQHAEEQWRAVYARAQADYLRMLGSDEVGVDFADPPHVSREARQRSYELLRSLLPESERHILESTHAVDVKATSGRFYRIFEDKQTRIFDRAGGGPIAQACLQLTIAAPPCDRMIAEYLLVKNDEQRYLETANVQPAIIERLHRCWWQPLVRPWPW